MDKKLIIYAIRELYRLTASSEKNNSVNFKIKYNLTYIKYAMFNEARVEF